MNLSVDRSDRSVRTHVDTGVADLGGIVALLPEASVDHVDPGIACRLLAPLENRPPLIKGLRDRDLALLGSEVRKALWHQDHPRAPVCGLTHQAVHASHVRIDISGGGHLDHPDAGSFTTQCENLRIDTFMSKPTPSMVESKLEPP